MAGRKPKKDEGMPSWHDFESARLSAYKSSILDRTEYSQRKLRVVSTTLPTLDKILSFNGKNTYGIPVGKITEVYGPEASCKSNFCVKLGAEFMKAGGYFKYCDVEDWFDPAWFVRLGVNINSSNFTMLYPDYLEHYHEIVEQNLRARGDYLADLKPKLQSLLDKKKAKKITSEETANLSVWAKEYRKPTLYVLDSGTALDTHSQSDDEQKDQPGDAARANSRFCRKLVRHLSSARSTFIVINQTRMTFSGGSGFGPKAPEATGGKAWKFYSSIRLKTARVASMKKGKSEIIFGDEIEFFTKKNKTGLNQFQRTIIRFKFGQGFDAANSIVNFLIENNQIKKAGAWYVYTNKEGKEIKWQGVDNTEAMLKNNPTIDQEWQDKIRLLYEPTE